MVFEWTYNIPVDTPSKAAGTYAMYSLFYAMPLNKNEALTWGLYFKPFLPFTGTWSNARKDRFGL